MPDIEKNKLVELIIKTSKRQLEITQANYHSRRAKKENFNLFLGIVNGKHPKDHIEKYHSNLIAYLLNPNGSHDCQNFFLTKFLETLKDLFIHDKVIRSKLTENHAGVIELEREFPINGRAGFIDIVIKSTDSVIFIENKIYSPERDGQIEYYCNWAEKHYPDKWFGIFLTRFGDPSVFSSKNLICLNYSNIITWLERCRSSKEIINYPHIVSAITQYIFVLNNITNTMRDEDQIQMNEHFNLKIDEAILLTEKLLVPKLSVENTLKLFIKEVRDAFIAELKNALSSRLEDLGFSPDEDLNCNLNGKNFFIDVRQNINYPDPDEDGLGMWWGIYQAYDQPFRRYNEFNIDPQFKYWKSISLISNVDNSIIDDYWEENTDKGSLLLLESIKDPKYRAILINHIIEKDILQNIKESKELIMKID